MQESTVEAITLMFSGECVSKSNYRYLKRHLKSEQLRFKYKGYTFVLRIFSGEVGPMTHLFLKTDNCWFYTSTVISDKEKGHCYCSSGIRQEEYSNFKGMEDCCKVDSKLTNRLKSLKVFRKELDRLIYATRIARHVDG